MVDCIYRHRNVCLLQPQEEMNMKSFKDMKEKAWLYRYGVLYSGHVESVGLFKALFYFDYPEVVTPVRRSDIGKTIFYNNVHIANSGLSGALRITCKEDCEEVKEKSPAFVVLVDDIIEKRGE